MRIYLVLFSKNLKNRLIFQPFHKNFTQFTKKIMLNTSIIALTLGSLSASPFFYAQNNFRAAHCVFNKFTAPVVFASRYQKFVAEHSVFQKMLNRGILIDMGTYSNTRYDEHQTINDYAATTIIRSCLFIDCETSLDNGGGLLVKATSGTVEIISTGFTNCKTSKKGGAFHCSSKKLTLDKSCISSCSASKDWDAFGFERLTEDSSEIRSTYIYNINPKSSSTAAVFINSSRPSIQINNLSTIERSSIKAILEFAEFDTTTFKYNLISECKGTSLIYFACVKTDTYLSTINFVKNSASDSIVHISEGYGKFQNCYFMNDDSKSYCNVYSRFEECVFNEPNDRDKFPNNDFTSKCTFNSKFTTADIDIPLETKNGCWIHLTPTQQPTTSSSESQQISDSGSITETPKPDSSSGSLTLASILISFAAIVIAGCAVGFFVIKWCRNRNSPEKSMMMMYSQV
ncbi:hypothetical protein TRFO_19107 [Tritrichomonas foetus]|uniref:Right handed beta helix domain-containing protein n=1 Tax=Tritrichomonas foetus TaxID=1144522 RepID=A0A1J4KK19_9EUKA|nr:hypothetical protein TRFO_19107 [Tritrichomonas foetus]|eukprot:OHT11466.1 hypothetical protein TRFO_19107 [Tritrichomonas foetus]